MRMMTTALVLIICFSASTLGGICGIGGGVVIKPLLDSIGIMSVSTVSFLSGLTVLAMACLNVLKNRRGGELDTARSVAAPGFIGLMLGICSSFLGIGGGPMNLAVLYYFFSMDTKKAAVNSILIILLSQLASLIFSLITGAVPTFSWSVLAAMVIAGAAGGLLSAHLHKKLSAHLTDRLFIGLLIVIFAICVYNAIRMLA